MCRTGGPRCKKSAKEMKMMKVADEVAAMHPRAKAAAALDSETSPDILRILSNDRNEYFRDATARNPSTPTDVLRTLSKRRAPITKACIASNPSTPADVLRTY